MPELVKKAAVWLGLVTDDRYDEEEMCIRDRAMADPGGSLVCVGTAKGLETRVIPEACLLYTSRCV